MKVFWISNVVIGEMCEELNVSHPASGGWLESMLKEAKENKNDKIIIITASNVKKIKYLKLENISYYVLPFKNIFEVNSKSKKLNRMVNDIIEKETPDIIHVWGTESQLSIPFIKHKRNIPSVIYIQGILSTIYRYYEAGMSREELKKAISLRDILKRDTILQQKNKYYKKSLKEKEVLRKAGNIIIENDWSMGICNSLNNTIKDYRCKLSIRNEFLNEIWDINNIENHSIMCNASGYPLKGLHILLKALKIVKSTYPDVKLYVPGTNILQTKFLRQTGYHRYIKWLIKELKLQENVEFLGILSASEMAKMMSKVNAFIVPSAIENHSSTLKEAMIIGTPCISSYVGGVPEYLKNQENGLLYRFEEYENLAQCINNIFLSKELAVKLSKNSQDTIRKQYLKQDLYSIVKKIYRDIIGEER